MRTVGVLGAAAFAIATVGTTFGSARAQSPQVPDSIGVTTAPALQGGSQDSVQQSRPVFKIGKLEVHIWAPMEPYYDANANRPAAEYPMWGSGE
jgi:hypothetical protein